MAVSVSKSPSISTTLSVKSLKYTLTTKPKKSISAGVARLLRLISRMVQ